MIIEDRKKSVESLFYILVLPNKVSWVADASVYTFMFVLYAGIVHVQCNRGLCVEMGYVNTILWKLHKIKYAIFTRLNTYLGHTGFAKVVSKNGKLVWWKLGKQLLS